MQLALSSSSLPPAPASVRTFPTSPMPHLSTPNWRPPKPPHSGCWGCSALSDPSLTSPWWKSHTTVHLSSSQADLGHFTCQSPCKQGEERSSLSLAAYHHLCTDCTPTKAAAVPLWPSPKCYDRTVVTTFTVYNSFTVTAKRELLGTLRVERERDTHVD